MKKAPKPKPIDPRDLEIAELERDLCRSRNECALAVGGRADAEAKYERIRRAEESAVSNASSLRSQLADLKASGAGAIARQGLILTWFLAGTLVGILLWWACRPPWAPAAPVAPVAVGAAAPDTSAHEWDMDGIRLGADHATTTAPGYYAPGCVNVTGYDHDGNESWTVLNVRKLTKVR